MGRQAYLTKIALGRSAFEPSQAATQFPEYIQLQSSQQEIPPAARQSNINRYIQLYDERGNPINPRAYEHGRRFREAQNDVLSSIGVVQRRPAPCEDLPGSYELRLVQLESEDSAGNAIALASTLTENLCTWWIGSLRDRILTFRFQHTIPFSQIVASQYHVSGTTLVYAGFASRLLSSVSVQASIYAAFVFRPLDRLLLATRASQKTKLGIRRWRNEIKTCFRMFVEFMFYPFAYHASLQRLGLIPARPLLPYWKAFIPFSKWSPIRPLSALPSLPATTPALDRCVAVCKAGVVATVTSPLVFICLEHFLERLVYAVVYEAIESTVIHPENPDLLAPDDGTKNRASAILGLRRKSPSPIRNIIRKLLVALGWGDTIPSSGATEQNRQSDIRTAEVEVQPTLEVGGRQVTNVNRLQLPTAHPTSNVSGIGSSAVPFNPSIEVTSQPTPPSPTESEASPYDNDPRIRITSREGIVEMEVRFPPHVLSTHTEIARTNSPTPGQRDVASQFPQEPETQMYHRVTQLSTESSQMIGAIFKAQIVGWATMPLKLVTLRLIAAHYLASHPGHVASYRVLEPLHSLRDLNLKTIGLLLSRVALCGALEVAIDLGLWGFQWIAVTWTGKHFFAWGAL